MTQRFTFKRRPIETGLAGVGRSRHDVDIKLNKKVVGIIYAPTWQTEDGLYRISLTVKDETGKCPWRWVRLKARFPDEESARDWLNAAFQKIQELYQLVCADD